MVAHLLSFLAVLAATLGTVDVATAPSASASTPRAVVGMPFNGKWAFNAPVSPPYTDVNSSWPGVHHRYYGDWATDLYAAAGTPVKLAVTSPDGGVSFSYRQSNDSCSSAGANVAGHGIVLNVSVNGVLVGSIDFEHLDNISGGPFTNGMTIGTITSEPLAGSPTYCYTARHTHLEMKNSTAGSYSCWVDHGQPGVTLNENDAVGVLGSSNSAVQQACTSIPASHRQAAGDYNGDGTTDAAVFRPSEGGWHIRGVADISYGLPGDIPVPADYNGDGITDIAVYRPSDGGWHIRGVGDVSYGQPGDIPVPGDYNGDGSSEAAVFRPSEGGWHIRGVGDFAYGFQTDVPVAGDYNGDGLWEAAVYRPSEGGWHVRGVGDFAYGASTDLPATQTLFNMPPEPPQAVTSVGADRTGSVSWSAAVSSLPVLSYTVTASPSGASCVVPATSLNCSIAGLRNGQTYTFTVTATNAVGVSQPTATSAPVVIQPPASLFHSVTPTRVLDSRGLTGGWNAKLLAGSPKELAITGGSLGIPANADAVVMNVTVTNGSNNSFLTVYPAGESAPNTSNLNFAPGQTIPNLVTVKIGAAGQVAFANATGATDVIADIVGYFDSVPGNRYNPVTPTRVLDSRGPAGGWNAKLFAGLPKNLTVRNISGVSATADAVVMNVTVTNGSNNSFLTVYPAGESAPNTSNLNFAAGQTIPNLVTVKIGAAGQVAFANATGATDVIADIVGYFDPSTGDVFHSVTPTRLLDSRGATGGWNARLAAGTPRSLAVTGATAPASTSAVMGNTTVTNGSNNSFVTIYPTGGAVPNASNVNFAAGQTIPNLTAVKVGAAGQIDFANAIGTTDVILDVVGYFGAT